MPLTPPVKNHPFQARAFAVTIIAFLITLFFFFTFTNKLPHPVLFGLGAVSFYLFYRAIILIGLFIPHKRLYAELLQEKLSATEEKARVQRYLDIAGVIFISLDQTGKITLINPMGSHVLERPGNETLGENWFDLFSVPDKRERHKKNFKKIITGTLKIRNTITTSIQTKSGIPKIIHWNNVLLTDTAGNITGTFSTGEDITAIRKFEQETAQAKLDWEMTFNAVSYGIAIIDGYNKILRVNSAMAAILKISPREAIGMSCHDLLHNESNNKNCLHCLTKEDQTAHTTEIFIKTTKKHYQIDTSLVNPGNENHSNIVYIAQDVTSIKETEFELRQIQIDLEDRVRQRTKDLSESSSNFKTLSKEFNTLLDAIPDILLLVSPEKNIIWANRGAALTFEMEAKHMIGEFCYDFLPCQCNSGSLENARLCPIHDALNGSPIKETVHTFPNGTIKTFRSFPIKDDTNRVLSVILVGTDVTERMALENEAIRTRHLSSLGELAAGVAHEINNPINGIINYAQLIVNACKDNDQQGDIAQRIIKEGDRIATIVSSLLSFARTPKIGQKNAVQVSDVIQDILALTEYQIAKELTHLKLNIPNDIKDIHANQHQVEQVLLNLVNNARYALNEKYPTNDPDKIIEIIARNDNHQGKEMVCITIKDHGTGIADSVSKNILDPFFSTKPKESGTGLGLSISHGIITEHHGKLDIKSIEGEYTSVEVCFPIRNSYDTK